MSEDYQKYLSTYGGRTLLEQHNLDETGLWRIRGEDPNCDMGGSHIQPDLGYAEGTLRSVIEYAVDQPAFWQWGAGGTITKVTSIKIDPNNLKRIRFLKDERTKLEGRIKEINEELKKYGVK